jgi:hypothetical protein
MAAVDKVGTRRKAPSKEGISLSALADRLGVRAAEELFSRIDGSMREGTMIIGASVRDARVGFSKAQTSGHAQVVISGRSSSGRHKQTNAADGMVILRMDDLEAVVRAAQEKFDWARTFAPRGGLEAATTSPILQRGSRGHRQLKA